MSDFVLYWALGPTVFISVEFSAGYWVLHHKCNILTNFKIQVMVYSVLGYSAYSINIPFGWEKFGSGLVPPEKVGYLRVIISI